MRVEIIKKKNNPIELLSYCGLFCGACPSYHRETCLGCRSEDRNQKRTSKWNCDIRECCVNEKEVLYCGKCSEFPCKRISRKLIDSHPNDLRFYYRHEIPENMDDLNSIGISKWITKQRAKWSCDKCGGTICFYEYMCKKCGKKVNPQN
ncbi:MAG: DUF3795 domain-containing protein [Candidatus Lokiarchaeota archaeon]|nr:DUF3795 domain-containing protein [Candidatus Lokiarchaeota archaeon]